MVSKLYMHANWDESRKEELEINEEEGDANSETSYAVHDNNVLITAEVGVMSREHPYLSVVCIVLKIGPDRPVQPVRP